MMRRLFTALGAVLTLMLPLDILAAQQPHGAHSKSESAAFTRAGWYELAPQHRVLITWAPTGSELRVLDFDSTRFHRLIPAGESTFVWRRGADSLNRIVQFRRRPSGEVAGFGWRGAAGDSGFVPRATEFPFEQHRVQFHSDSIILAGTALIPRARPFAGTTDGMPRTTVSLPGAVLVHGSGDSDRDNVWAFTFAQHLAREGVAVLIPDKRGSGGSGGEWRRADFAMLAADALAAARVLAEFPNVDPDRIGYLGLSQGGWIAPLAASKGDAAFVVDISGASVTPAQQVRHEITQDLRSAGMPDTAAAQVLGVFDRAMQFSRTLSDSAWYSYAAERARLSTGPLAEAIKPFPESRDHWQWRWWNGVADFDPVPYWRALDLPALVIYGARDAEDNVPVEESVRRLRAALEPERNPQHRIHVFPELGHTLVDPATGWISREALNLLAQWILDSTR